MQTQSQIKFRSKPGRTLTFWRRVFPGGSMPVDVPSAYPCAWHSLWCFLAALIAHPRFSHRRSPTWRNTADRTGARSSPGQTTFTLIITYITYLLLKSHYSLGLGSKYVSWLDCSLTGCFLFFFINSRKITSLRVAMPHLLTLDCPEDLSKPQCWLKQEGWCS